MLDKNIKRKYYFEDYDQDWVKRFSEIKSLLQSVFGDKALKIEHIGSTSIPGMKAKPLIDVLVTVQKMEEFLEQRKKLVSMGYGWGENYIAPHTQLFFKMAEDGSKTENIHICESGSLKEKQFLVMRDFFRAFPEKAKEYSDLKAKNQALYPDDYPAYRKAKEPFLQKIEKEAYFWNYKNILKSEGFPIVYDWFDEPGTEYPPHIHKGKVSFYVVEGSVTFSGGIQKTVSEGERIDVPLNIEHSAIVGEKGCRYVVGQEIEDDA